MKLGSILFCIFTLLCTQAQTQPQSQFDSLVLQLDTLRHDQSRLAALRQLVEITSGEPDRHNIYAQQLLDEAERQNNDNYKCDAHFHLLIQAFNMYNAEQVNFHMEKLEPLARRNKRYDMLFKGWRCKLELIILTQDYERCEKEAKQMLTQAETIGSKSGALEAYQCLANIYRTTFRGDQALELLEKSRKVALELKLEDTVINIWQTILFVCEEMGNDEAWLHNLTHYEAYLKTPIKNNQPPLLIVYAGYVNYYSRKHNWAQSERYLQQGEVCYAQVTSPLYRVVFDNSCAAYYTRAKKYDLALDRKQKALDQLRPLNEGADYHNLLLSKALLLDKSDHHEEALPIFKEVFEFKEKLQLATIDKQYQQIRKDFNADRLLVEQTQIRYRMQLFTLLLLGGGLLLIISSIFYLLFIRHTLKKNEREMREMTLKMTQANDAKNRFLSNIGSSIREPLHTVVEGARALATHEITDETEQRQLSTTIRTLSGGLMKMINNILDLSRLEAGMMKFNISTTELTTLIHNAKSSANSSGYKVNLNFPANTLYMICTDGSRMQQVIENLLTPLDLSTEIQVSTREEALTLYVDIIGSQLSVEAPAQEILILNEINRMLIMHFDGKYEVNSKSGVITICLPLCEITRTN